MNDRARRPDLVTLAGHAWVNGDIPARAYFALVRRHAHGPSWRERLAGWWKGNGHG